ncbi:MAG: hypothetical protein Q8R28_10365 [Dehalococcoidia bacterium]|nr:hypothetical protein [Dehalococcoidia bacterium]
MVSLAGLAVSVSQVSITGVPGQEVPVTGRVTAFGLGVPALVQITLSGPTEEVFTTFAGPDGNYDVSVAPTTPGLYRVDAQAFPPFPGLGNFLPPIARSPGLPTLPELPPEAPEAPRPSTFPQPPITIPVDIQIPPAPQAPRQQLFTAPSIFEPIDRPGAPELELSPIIAFAPGPTGQASGRIVGFVLGDTSGTHSDLTGFTPPSTAAPSLSVVFLRDFDPAQYQRILESYIAAGFTEDEARAAADRITVSV